MSAYRESLLFLGAAPILALVLSVPAGSHAAWPPNGIPACRAAGEQRIRQLIADQDGGVILAWEDERSQYTDIYAQRIDATGELLWSTGGVAVCTAFPWQRYPALVSDGSNGAIIAWDDLRIGDAEIYAQRIDAAGVPLWARNGVPVCTSQPADVAPVAVSDGAGGAIIAWMDMRGLDLDIYAQRIDGSGVTLWQTDGVPVCTAPSSQSYLRMVSDNAGRALLVWEDGRKELSNDLYAQCIDASGDALWTKDGLLVSTAEGRKETARVAPDGTGGAFITWQTYANGFPQVWVQRLDASGNRLWGNEGLAAYTERASQRGPDLAADGTGGVVVAWMDYRNARESDIYAQRFDPSGASLWLAEGVPLCTAQDNQWFPRLVADADGDVIVVWGDSRLPGLYDSSIYAQKLSAAGEPLWAPGGVSVCTIPGIPSNHTIVSTQAGASIVAWDDHRDDVGDIYAQRLESATAIVVQEFNVIQTATSLRLLWKLAIDAERALDSIGIQRAPSANGPWSRLLTLRRGDPIEFEDFEVRHTEAYWYSLLLLTLNGSRETTNPIRVEFRGVARPTGLLAPYVFPEGTIELRYSLAARLPIRLEIFDVSGLRIWDIDLGTQEPGEHHVTWDGLNASGIRVPAGIYLLRLMSGSEVHSRKLPFVR